MEKADFLKKPAFFLIFLEPTGIRDKQECLSRTLIRILAYPESL